jgi:hypothetical protein
MIKTLLRLQFIACVLCAGNCWAQTGAADTSLRHKQTDFAQNLFVTQIGQQSKIANGAEYSFYGPIYRGSPYFMSGREWNKGTITFNNVVYKNISILYDKYQDLLVLLHFNKFQQYSLYGPRVQSFDLLNHHFVYLADESESPQIKNGFYEELYKGKVNLYARHETLMEDSAGVTTVYKKFYHQDSYFIKRDEKYFKVKSRGDVASVLKERKKELEKYAKTNKLDFSDNRQQALIQIVTYYEQLSK